MEWGLIAASPVALSAKPSRELGGFDPIARLLKDFHCYETPASTRLISLSSSYLPPVTIMSQPSVAKFVMKRSWLNSWMKPLANWYANVAGYRQLGLRYAYFFCGQWLLWAIFG